MSLEESAISVLDGWYSGLETYQDKLPAKGSIGGSLHILERLRVEYALDVAAHVAGGEAQIRGLSAGAVRKLLARFGEGRALSSIGGRTNRGARGDIAKLLAAMKPLRLEGESDDVRNHVLEAMQRHIVTKYVPRYFAAKRVKAAFDTNAATSRFIAGIIENARASGKGGAVAEYLVGAKLALLFPEKQIRNKRFSTADVGFEGDFEVGNTVFHVTLAPMPELFEKLKGNLERGMRIYLLVTETQVVGAKQNAELHAAGRIAVEAIESFVATNLDEAAEFDDAQLKSGCRRLLEVYNERVAAVEHDKSMLIEIPPNV